MVFTLIGVFIGFIPLMQAVLSAMHLMYTTPSRDGAFLYGEHFRSGEQLVYKHLTAAGTTDCDHWHDGPGKH